MGECGLECAYELCECGHELGICAYELGECVHEWMNVNIIKRFQWTTG